MAIVEVKVPQLSESVAEATMLQWKKKAGEAVAAPVAIPTGAPSKVLPQVPVVAPDLGDRPEAVSYTHLTLPTICSV